MPCALLSKWIASGKVTAKLTTAPRSDSQRTNKALSSFPVTSTSKPKNTGHQIASDRTGKAEYDRLGIFIRSNFYLKLMGTNQNSRHNRPIIMAKT